MLIIVYYARRQHHTIKIYSKTLELIKKRQYDTLKIRLTDWLNSYFKDHRGEEQLKGRLG